MKTMKAVHAEVKPGDLILPPARELSLWMRRKLAKEGLPEESLLLTVSEVLTDYKQDKGGSWTFVRAKYSKEFGKEAGFNFFVRPNTPICRKVA